MVFAATFQVANPGNGNDIQPNIQAAVNSAANGDVIVLPEGQFVVNKNVIISKFISIKGQGRTKTILYRSESVSDATLQSSSWIVIFRFNINSNTSSKIVVSDICFKSKKPSMNSIVDRNGTDSLALDGLSLAKDMGVEFVKCLDFVVTGCRFENFGNGAVSIQHDDSIVGGLIYKNEFVHNAKGSAALGLGYGVVVYGTNTKWIDNPRFGTSNFIFIEDNYFDYHRHSVAAGGCALYVFRRNYVLNNVAGNTSHAIDAHEARLSKGVNYYSTRAIEVYNDSLVNTQFRDGSGDVADGTAIKSVTKPTTTNVSWLTEAAIKTRGGEAMIHDNYIEGYRFGVGLIANNILTNPYPIPYQQGYLSALKFGAGHTGVGSGKESGDNFMWNDKFVIYASGNSANTYFYNYSSSYLVNDRDYHLSANSAYTTYTYPHPLRGLKSTNGSVIAVITSQKNVSCNGGNNGTATVSSSGGSSPYTYSWNTSPVKTTSSITGLAAGAYAVVISDATGSKITVNFNITQPIALVATLSSTNNVKCNGGNTGSATVSGSGGTSPYTYSWNTSPVQTTATAINLSAGSYTASITDALGCSKSINVAITQSSILSASLSSSNNVKCFGANTGSATVAASGGTSPYTYSWNTSPVQTTNTASNLAAGTYTVSVTDASGCSKTVNATITQPSALSASISSSSNVKCFGGNTGSATVSVSGGASPYTYSWNTSPVQTTATASKLPAGVYVANITDAYSCTQNVRITISQPLALSASISGSNNVNCKGSNTGSATVSVSGGTTPYTYSWNTSPAQTTATANNLAVGTYTANITDAMGCSNSVNVTIIQSLLSLNINSSSNVKCNGGNTGSATVSASGGTSPYTYSWNTTPVQTTSTASNLLAGTYTASITDAIGCSKSINVTITQPSLLSVSISSSSNAKCNGGNNGSATVIASGGTSPYTYSWNTNPVQTTTTANNLAAGTYTASVTDASGCSKTVSVTITQPTALSAIISSSSNVKCFGGNTGSATVSASGGTSPYTYSWNTSPVQTTVTASNLAAGTYTVSITDASGCNKTVNVSITQPPILAASVSSQNNIKCNGGNTGSATVSVSGGTTPYTYSWNTSPAQTTATANNLAVGTYTANITDAMGCRNSVNVTIIQSLFSVNINSSINVKCNGGNTGSTTVSASGGTSPYTYSWNTSPVQTTATASDLTAGTYTVTVTDALGCNKSINATITQPSVLSVSISSSSNVKCNGVSTGSATVGVSGGTLPYSYSWNTNPVQTTAIANNLAAGTYTASVTDASGCSKTVSVTITQPTALSASISRSTNIKCFGNNTGLATVSASGGTSPYTYSWNTSPVQTTVTASNLAAGTYTVSITDASGCNKTVNATITQPPILAASVSSQNNVKCNGGNTGSATVSASGGTSPYTYSWNTSPVQTTVTASNLTAGTYTVSITDAMGCSKLVSVVISQPAVLAASLSNVNVKCNGDNTGSATATVSGGTSPYTYSWNTSPVQTTSTASSLTAGTYTVNVFDASGCSKSMDVLIRQPSILSANISSSSNIKCFGDTAGLATVIANGGTLPYSYSWNTSPVQTTATVSNLPSGNYTASVIDSFGCSKFIDVTITESPELSANISSYSNVKCFGDTTGSATVIASGGISPYTYSWNTTPVQTTTTASNLIAGTYTASIIDAFGCRKTVNVTISQPLALSASISSFSNVNCKGANTGSATVSVNGGTSPYTYSWNTIPVQTTAKANNLPTGTYTASITDASGCSTSINRTITQASDLTASIKSSSNVKCNNGNTGNATVNVNGGTLPYSYSWNTLPVQTTVTASDLAVGTYTASVTDASGCSAEVNITITQPTALLASINSSINVICNGDSTGLATVSASGGALPYSYSWNTSPVQTTVTVSNLGAGTYTASITDALGCIKTADITITQPIALSATSSVSNVKCFGDTTGSATVIVSGGTAPYTYVWNTSPVQTTAIINNKSAGSYILQVSDSAGCTQRITTIISEPTQLSLSLLDTLKLKCYNITESATVNVKGGTAPYFYSWNTSPQQIVPTLDSLSPGTYIVSVTDSEGCFRMDSILVTSPSELKIDFTSTIENCGKQDASLTVIPSGGTPPYLYLWDTGETTIDLTGIRSSNYMITVTDANSCTQTNISTVMTNCIWKMKIY
jgi:SprB repeat